MTRLPYCSRFDYGANTLEMSLPITTWNRALSATGGDIEADSGVRASFIVRRDEALTFSIRMYEDEWPEVQAFLDYAQMGGEITWFPDRDSGSGIACYLDAPAVGDSYSVTPDDQYPRVLLLSVTLVRPGGVAWDLTPRGYVVHTFVGIFNAEFVVVAGSGMVRRLRVGGGGGGAAADGSGVECGGGGAGGVIDDEVHVSPGTYPVVIGQGGLGGVGDHTLAGGALADDYGDPGGDTTFAGGPPAKGGGGGGTHLTPTGDPTFGGSGGGTYSNQGVDEFGFPADPPIVRTNIDNAVAGQGYQGGDGINDASPDAYTRYGGGGGGAGGPGENYITGAGGPGVLCDIDGLHYYGGGGGAGRALDGGPGGIGGGGHGGLPNAYDPAGEGTPGEDGTGGGGGGGGGVVGAQGCKGGNGICIIRYTVASGIVAIGGDRVEHDT